MTIKFQLCIFEHMKPTLARRPINILIIIAALVACSTNARVTNYNDESLPLSYHNGDFAKIEATADQFAVHKSWRKAADLYKDLIEMSPLNARYHYKYGGALAMLAQQGSKLSAVFLVADIEQAFTETLRLDPSHVDAHWALIELYLQLPAIFGGSERKALSYANQLQAISAIDGFLARAHICEFFRRYSDAEKWYLKAWVTGHSKTCADKLSSLYEKMGQPGKAMSVRQSSFTAAATQKN